MLAKSRALANSDIYFAIQYSVDGQVPPQSTWTYIGDSLPPVSGQFGATTVDLTTSTNNLFIHKNDNSSPSVDNSSALGSLVQGNTIFIVKNNDTTNTIGVKFEITGFPSLVGDVYQFPVNFVLALSGGAPGVGDDCIIQLVTPGSQTADNFTFQVPRFLNENYGPNMLYSLELVSYSIIRNSTDQTFKPLFVDSNLLDSQKVPYLTFINLNETTGAGFSVILTDPLRPGTYSLNIYTDKNKSVLANLDNQNIFDFVGMFKYSVRILDNDDAVANHGSNFNFAKY